MDVKQLGLYVIRPTLAALATVAPGIDGPVAEALLLGTAAQESQFRYLHQEGGPALGLWQMEPRTHDDLQREFTARTTLWDAVMGCCESNYSPGSAMVPPPSGLIFNLRYAAAMARLLYWRDPEPLPVLPLRVELYGVARHLEVVIEARLLWPTYKRVWNSEKGKATMGEFVNNYATLVGSHWPPTEP